MPPPRTDRYPSFMENPEHRRLRDANLLGNLQACLPRLVQLNDPVFVLLQNPTRRSDRRRRRDRNSHLRPDQGGWWFQGVGINGGEGDQLALGL